MRFLVSGVSQKVEHGDYLIMLYIPNVLDMAHPLFFSSKKPLYKEEYSVAG